MKPLHMIINPGMNLSFRIAHERNADLFRDSRGFVPLHIHKEYEIMAILKGNGTRVVGSTIENFEEGEVIVIGPNIPHVWQGELKIGSKDKTSEYIYLCFDEKSFSSFFSLPEMQEICALLKRSAQGLKFTGTSAQKAIELLTKISQASMADRIILMLQLLNVLTCTKDVRVLNSKAISQGQDMAEADRVNKIYKYVLENYSKDITLGSIASHIGMSPNAFSRFFKAKAYKHFVEFLNEVRITNATRLISDDSLNISEVAYKCGYNSISNFNRQFKRYTKHTPLEYKQKLMKSM